MSDIIVIFTDHYYLLITRTLYSLHNRHLLHDNEKG